MFSSDVAITAHVFASKAISRRSSRPTIELAYTRVFVAATPDGQLNWPT